MYQIYFEIILTFTYTYYIISVCKGVSLWLKNGKI